MIDAIVWTPGVSLEQMEKQIIMAALKLYGAKAKVADALGVSVKTIDNKLERYAKESQEEKINADRRRDERERFLARARGLGAENPIMANEEPHHGESTTSGVRLESSHKAAQEHEMSVSEREELEKVLSPKTASGGNGRRR